MDTKQYQDYVLVVLFIKYISDKIVIPMKVRIQCDLYGVNPRRLLCLASSLKSACFTEEARLI